MPRRRDVTLDSEGISLVGALFEPDRPGPHPALVICHGLPGGLPQLSEAQTGDQELSYPDLASVCAARGFTTLVFNFRGTGGSGGNFSALGWASDLEAALAWMRDQQGVDVDRIAVLGSSMGAQVAICVAARRPEVAGLVAFASPLSSGWRTPALEMVAHFREIGIIRDRDFPLSVDTWRREFEELDPLKAVARIAPRPLLILQGDADDIVAPDSARVLAERAGRPAELLVLPGVGHRFRREPRAIAAALDWLERTFPPT